MTKSTIPANKGDFECLVLVKHDGTSYAPGSRINLSAEQAKSLLACNAIKEAKTAPKGE